MVLSDVTLDMRIYGVFLFRLKAAVSQIRTKGENSVTHEIGPINSDFSKNAEQMKKLSSVL